MGVIDLNINSQLEAIERKRREQESELYNQTIKLYNRVLDFKLNYGKYNGKTIKEVLNIDKQYVYWIFKETYRTGIKINSINLIRIVDYYENVKRSNAYKQESQAKDKAVDKLIKDGMSPGVAYDIVHNRNCRDFGM